MNAFMFYQELIKPSWAPPAWLFGPVWTVLYIFIALSFGVVLYKAFTKRLPVIVAIPFVLNLIFNVAFTPIQFGLQSNVFAAIDILLVLGTLIWAMMVIFPCHKWIAYIQIPYFLWVSFATVLQLTITFLNW